MKTKDANKSADCSASVEPYPCCNRSQTAINAALTLCKDEGISPDDIDEVIIAVNSITESLIDNPEPKTPYGCKFSIQYCVDEAILRGAVVLESFNPDAMRDKKLREFLLKTKVRHDMSVQKIYDEDPSKLASKVIIKLKDGRSVEKLVEYPKGDPENPMSWEESADKFRLLTKHMWGEKVTEQLIKLVDKLETVDDFAKDFPSSFK